MQLRDHLHSLCGSSVTSSVFTVPHKSLELPFISLYFAIGKLEMGGADKTSANTNKHTGYKAKTPFVQV